MDSKKAMNTGQTKNRRHLNSPIVTLFCLLLLATGLQAQDWKASKFPIEETITGMHFPTPSLGYLVTSGGKYGITRDGGKYWDLYTIAGARALEDVYFKSKDTGLAVGRFGQIYRTVDGTKQWEDRSIKDTTVWITSAVFLNDTIALATGLKPSENLSGVLYRSTDGGKKWEKSAVTGMGFGELCLAKGLPVCFQSFGRLNYSTDKGATWQFLTTVSGKAGRATAFYNNTGIICGNEVMCAFSRDRGKTWTTVPLEGDAALTSAVLVDDSLGYVGGTGGHLMVTRDGGKTWKKDGPLPQPVDIAKLTIAGDKLFVGAANGFVFYRPLPKK